MQVQIELMITLFLIGTGVIAFALWLDVIIEIFERIVKLIMFVLRVLIWPIKCLTKLIKGIHNGRV